MSKIKKLGLSIVCFDGSEHLKNIIYELRNLVDVIHVCMQEVSYHGDPLDDEDKQEVLYLKEIGYVDDILWFNPDLSYLKQKEFDASIPRRIECDKRNMMLDKLEEAGCSHSIIIDSDEFYDFYDFKRAKDFINENENIHITYCQYVNYYNDYDRILVYPFLSYVPFISEARFRFQFDSSDINLPSDPTRRYKIPETDENRQYNIFDWKTVHMHHLSWIRKDITKKLKNWSAKRYFENVAGLQERIINRYRNWKPGLNAYLMFNVPGNAVIVNKLDKKYIKPHYKIYEQAIKGEFRQDESLHSGDALETGAIKQE